MLLTLLLNIALLVALSVVHQWVLGRWRERTFIHDALSGVLFGAIAVVGMMTPFRAAEGIQYDGRSIIVAVASMFGGPVVGAITGTIAAIYRVSLGGAGATAGVAVIAESAALGIAYFYARRRWRVTNRWFALWGLAFAVHAVMLAIQWLLLPGDSGAIVLQIWAPVLVLYPVGMMLVCRLMLDQEARLADEDALRDLNESLEDMVEARTAELMRANERLAATSSQLAETNVRLQEASEAKSQFLRSMSHELRTPLNSIIGFSTLLIGGQAGPVTDEQHRQLEMINGSGRRLLAIISDILDLSRIEARGVQLELETFDAVSLARESAGTVAPDAEAKGLTLELDLPDEAISMTSDRLRVGQIVLNLLANATKFTETGGVTLRVRRDGTGTIAFEVSDTGPGVPEEMRERIFTEFVQSDDSVEGTGLGLAISRNLARVLGGSLELTGDGSGSTFTLVLPQTLAAPAAPED